MNNEMREYWNKIDAEDFWSMKKNEIKLGLSADGSKTVITRFTNEHKKALNAAINQMQLEKDIEKIKQNDAQLNLFDFNALTNQACSHKWKPTMLVYRTVYDCILCGAKKEDV